MARSQRGDSGKNGMMTTSGRIDAPQITVCGRHSGTRYATSGSMHAPAPHRPVAIRTGASCRRGASPAARAAPPPSAGAMCRRALQLAMLCVMKVRGQHVQRMW